MTLHVWLDCFCRHINSETAVQARMRYFLAVILFVLIEKAWGSNCPEFQRRKSMHNLIHADGLQLEGKIWEEFNRQPFMRLRGGFGPEPMPPNKNTKHRLNKQDKGADARREERENERRGVGFSRGMVEDLLGRMLVNDGLIVKKAERDAEEILAEPGFSDALMDIMRDKDAKYVFCSCVDFCLRSHAYSSVMSTILYML